MREFRLYGEKLVDFRLLLFLLQDESRTVCLYIDLYYNRLT